MLPGLIAQHNQHQGNRRGDPHQEKCPANRAALFPIKFVSEYERNSGAKRATCRADQCYLRNR
jgi:hypothetical protein